jgi:hypothetical protein
MPDVESQFGSVTLSYSDRNAPRDIDILAKSFNNFSIVAITVGYSMQWQKD